MSDLDRIVKLAELLVKQQEAVKAAEDALKEAKENMLRTEREDLPQLMQEAGLQEIKLTDGQKVELKEDVSASITEKTKEQALAWLLSNGFGGIIKTEVALAFGRGDHDKATTVAQELSAKYPGVALNEVVHPSTLKAFVKEQLGEGVAVPFDLFNVYPFTKAVIRRN